jgi:anti-sigma B factor antagonist
MEIVVRRAGKVTILNIEGSLTIGGGDTALRDRFRDALDAGGKMFIFNMRGVTYMDSGGLGETAACSKRACDREAVIKLVVSPGGKVDQILKITRLDRAFEVFNDEEEALASFIR